VPTVHVRVNQPVHVTPLNANLLRLGEWQMSLLDNSGAPVETETVTPMPLPNQLAQGGFRFAPAIGLHFGAAPELALHMLRVIYRT